MGRAVCPCTPRVSECVPFPKHADPYSSSFRLQQQKRARRFKPTAKSQPLKAFYKILARQLLHLPCQFKLEQRRKYLGGRQRRLQPFHNFINVSGFVSLEERENLFFVRRQLRFPE